MGKTAAELTAQERLRYRELARIQADGERDRDEARRERALAVARDAARVLREEFGAARVFLFGSLATGGLFHTRSDIDLGVEGLRRDEYWHADCRLEALAGDLEIDLVDLGSASSTFADAVRRDGEEL